MVKGEVSNRKRGYGLKDKLTIGEFAKLRNITTETLRHYDRIGLVKPVKVDPDTGYRYYSILQYEKIGTIMNGAAPAQYEH